MAARKTILALMTVVLAAVALTAGSQSAGAVEFLFTRDYYKERDCRPAVKAVRHYRRGRLGRRHSVVERKARYRFRKRRIMVRPPQRKVVVRHGRRVVKHVKAKYRVVTERVLVRPVRYRARLHPGKPGWVRDYVVVKKKRAYRKHCH